MSALLLSMTLKLYYCLWVKNASYRRAKYKVKSHLENPYQTQPFFKKVNILIELWEKLREKAAESGISPSKLLEELIESLLPDDENDPSKDTVPLDEPDDEDEADDDTIPLDLSEDLPNFAKRYRANFRYQNDYYSPKVNSYFFDNGKLVIEPPTGIRI